MAGGLLGDDGRGYELARRLDGCGAWRAWLGDSAYASLAPSLSSPSAWESFLSPGNPHVRLQLRARALLYDKASVALSFRGVPSDPSDLTSSYLQLHGDDVYYSLESAEDDAVASKMQSRSGSSPSKSNGSHHNKSSTGSRVVEPESENTMQKDKPDDLQDLWYDQFIEKYKVNRHLKSSFAERDSMKRTPEGMSSYLKLVAMQKRRRIAFKDGNAPSLTNSVADNGTFKLQEKMEDDIFVIPELMFPNNCVPDNNFFPSSELESSPKVEVYGILDSLPHLITPSPAMIERFGIRPEYLKVEFGRSKYRGKGRTKDNKKCISSEQASQATQKVVAQVLVSTGLDGGSDISIQTLSQFLHIHICKLGRILKILTDSYRKQFTSTEVIKMFLRTTGQGNIGVLSDYLKSNTRKSSLQIQQSQSLQGQHEGHHLPTQQQQGQRAMISQLSTLRPQNIVFQQQQLQMQQQQQQMQMQQQQMQMQFLQQHQMQLQKQQQQQQHQQQQQLQMHMHMQQQKQQQIQMQQQQQLQIQMQQQQQQQQQQPQQQSMSQQHQQMLSQSQQMQSQPQQLQMHQQQHQQLSLHQQQLQMHQHLYLRHRQMSAARESAIALEKERSGGDAKNENIAEHSTDGSFNPVNRQQLQFKNQTLSNPSNAQPGKQFNQFTVQSPQLQTQGNFSMRTPPVKVEGFQELMGGGDGASLRQESEERKLTSPSK